MAERLRVFVSSRMRELANERAAVEQALEAMGADAFVFEGDAGARPGSGVATYRDELARSDVYLGIFWLGYGDYTRDEYDTAVRLDLPCLLYEKPPGAGEQRDPELQRFLDAVGDVDTGHVTTAWFEDAGQLAGWVRRDVDRLRTEALRRQIHAGAFRYRHGTAAGGRVDQAEPPVVKLRRPPLAGCPAPPQPFVDRERPLQRVAQALDAGERLVGFRGEPGMGKTALLARLAVQRATAHPDGAVCVEGRDHAARRDVLADVWARFHETATPYVPDDARLSGDLAGRQALVTVDDVGLEAGEVQQLAADLPGSAVAVAAAPAEGLDPLSYVKAVQIGGFDDPEHTLALFAAEYGDAVPPDLREVIVGLCAAAGGGPGHVKRLANQAWGSDASLADWAAQAAGALPGPQDSLRSLAVAGPGVAVPAGVAQRMGVPPAELAALEAGGMIRAASPRYVVDGAAWAATAGAEELRPRAFAATLDWVAAAPAAEIAGSRAFLTEMLRWGRSHGRDAEVVELARAAEGPFATAGWWGAWEVALDTASAAAAATGDRAAAAWADHQRGTRSGALGRRDAARMLLERALATRTNLGDHDGAALTRHNMRTLGLLPPLPPPQPPKRWWQRWPAVLGTAAIVAAAAVAVGWVALRPGGTGALAASPDPLSFSVPAGETGTMEVRLTNEGDAALLITGAELTGDPGPFRLVDPAACDGRLGEGSSCALAVAFMPPGAGEFATVLRVDTTDGVASVTITGVGAAAELEITPADVDFGTVPVGRPSDPEELTLVNSGSLAVAIDRLALEEPSDAFALDTSACGAELSPGSSCVLRVTFAPPMSGGHAVTLVAAGGGLRAAADLAGTGEAGRLDVAPAVVDFDRVTVGASADRDVRIANRGPGAVTIASAAVTGGGPYVLLEDGCSGRALGDGDDCALRIEFRPVGRGPALGGVEVVADGEASRVALTGTGTQGDLVLTPLAVEFGAVDLGTAGRQVVTVTNAGNGELVVADLAATPAEFSIGRGTDCPRATLVPEGECKLEVLFSPRAAGDAVGTLEVAARVDATGVEVETATLRGAGIEPAPGEAFFSEPPVEDLDGQPAILWQGVASTETREVDVTNVGDGPLLMQFRVAFLNDPPFEPPGTTDPTFVFRPAPPITVGPSRTVPDLARFLQLQPFSIIANSCAPDVPLGPGESCQLTLRFAPQGLGVLEAYARLDVAYLQGIGPDEPCCLLVGTIDLIG